MNDLLLKTVWFMRFNLTLAVTSFLGQGQAESYTASCLHDNRDFLVYEKFGVFCNDI